MRGGPGPSLESTTDNNQNNAKSDKSSNRIVSYIHSCVTSQFNVPSNQMLQNSIYCNIVAIGQYALLTYGDMPVQPRLRVKILLKFEYENIVWLAFQKNLYSRTRLDGHITIREKSVLYIIKSKVLVDGINVNTLILIIRLRFWSMTQDVQ